MNFSIKDFLRKCDQIHSLRSFLQIWSQLLKKSLMKNFIFCAVKKKKTFDYGWHISVLQKLFYSNWERPSLSKENVEKILNVNTTLSLGFKHK